jgi:outer membrane biosynthesis protein TonB
MYETSQAEHQRRRRLYLRIAGFHATAILLVALVYHIPRRKREPKPPRAQVMPVKLAHFPAPTPPAPTPPAPTPPPAPSPPPTPEPVVTPPPPKPEPAPKPKPKTVTPPKPKPKPKPLVQEKPKPKPKPKPKESYSSADKIRERFRQQQQNQPKPPPQPPKQVEVRPKVDVDAKLEEIRRRTDLEAAESVPAVSASDLRQSYYAEVHRQLYIAWIQPSVDQVSPSASPVIVRLTVSASGAITARSVVSESDNPNLTSSVRGLLQNIQRLPAPPPELGSSVSLSVSLRIRG